MMGMFDKDLADIRKRIVMGVNAASVALKKNIDEKTPEDTRRLVGNNDIKLAIRSNGKTIGGVINKTPYAAYVEYGVFGREYRYNKPKGTIFYTGVGARMFSRAKDDMSKQIKEIIDQYLSTS